jgi:glucose-6-phosphate isomerase
MPLSLDYTFMMSPPVANGITEAEFSSGQRELRAALDRVSGRRSAGQLGFLDLPASASNLRSCQALALEYSRDTDDLVVLGIGGSALGTIALRTALLAPHWNSLDSRARSFRPRLHVLDNVDPRTVSATLKMVNPARSLFVVISKSGSTAETMAQYLIVRAQLDASLGADAIRRLVFVTDPSAGALRAAASEEGIATLEVPPNVGGRFSVLSPVGIFPAIMTGMDAAALLRGAAAMAARCGFGDGQAEAGVRGGEDQLRSPAAIYALVQWLSDVHRNARINVMMPYSDALRDFSSWFVQLWAESLGKISADGRHVGPTPLAALGATDQHSQVQLFMEGPLDKTITFVGEMERGADQEIPVDAGRMPDLRYLGGHTLGELLDAERKATAGALATRGRPSMTVEIPVVDEYHVGEMIMMFELATVIAGELYGIEPLNQPGVELGKQFTYAIMGKPGSEKDLRAWESLPRSDPARRV